MIPVVKRYDSPERESIDSYIARWPKQFSNIPPCVIENWIHRHNPQFINDWPALNPSSWRFNLREMSSSQIMAIQHLDGELEHWDYIGNKFLETKDENQYLARYMAKHGTFPCPIIVAVNAQGVLHPKSRPGEFMKTPMQLIEGHRRLGFLREMIRRNWPYLTPFHKVWEMSFS